ncbi:hypothetical protein LCGC14_0317610 [marine sediment metagenome]|uniref:PABS domain-containing protein n=1 Tax=marine sediment metagenome TaxID=412755 RepID=A0A0F9U2G6_9ZZZZ
MPELNRWEKEGAIQWDDSVKFKTKLLIDAKSYNRWVNKQMPMLTKMKTSDDSAKCEEISIGQCRLYRRIFHTHRWDSVWTYSFLAAPSGFNWIRNGLRVAQGATKQGIVYFTGPVNVPVLSREGGGTWMSLSPNEIMTLRPGIRKAKGNVVIAGLGMGWMARKVCEKKSVKSVTIVEINPYIAAYFGEILKKDFPEVKIVISNAWDYLKGRSKKFDSHLFDIWKGYGHECEKFKEFQKKHPGAWAWGYYPLW